LARGGERGRRGRGRREGEEKEEGDRQEREGLRRFVEERKGKKGCLK